MIITLEVDVWIFFLKECYRKIEKPFSGDGTARATQHGIHSQLKAACSSPGEGACLGGPLCTFPVPSTTIGGSGPSSMRRRSLWARTSLTDAGFFHEAGKLECTSARVNRKDPQHPGGGKVGELQGHWWSNVSSLLSKSLPSSEQRHTHFQPIVHHCSASSQGPEHEKWF